MRLQAVLGDGVLTLAARSQWPWWGEHSVHVLYSREQSVEKGLQA